MAPQQTRRVLVMPLYARAARSDHPSANGRTGTRRCRSFPTGWRRNRSQRQRRQKVQKAAATHERARKAERAGLARGPVVPGPPRQLKSPPRLAAQFVQLTAIGPIADPLVGVADHVELAPQDLQLDREPVSAGPTPVVTHVVE